MLPKLTIPQLATLTYIWERCEITIHGKRTGTIPMKKLVELGLLSCQDSSYGNKKQTSWCLTSPGKKFIEDNYSLGLLALQKMGWE